MNQFLILLFSFFLVLQAGFVAAASNEDINGTWFLSIDNDLLASSDDDYTSGIQAGWVSGYLASYSEGPVPQFLAERLDDFGLLNGSHRQRFISHSLSHRIFTPGDTQTSELIEGDIPYTGMLFATLTAGAQDDQTMDAFSFHYGVAGPAALGEQTQNEIHKIIGSLQVNGWDNQIHNEVLLNLNYEHRRRLAAFEISDGVKADILGQVGGAIGNLISMGTAGVGGRIGWGLQDDFAIPPQFFGEETIGSRPYSKGTSEAGFWFFALINGSAIGNAIFWDGNTFRDSPSVDYDPLIGRIYLGAVARLDRLSITFSIAKTSVPWDNPSDKSVQSYARLGFNYTY
jgi:hypothetical protein